MVAKSSVPSIVTGLEMWGQNFILDIAPAWAGKPSLSCGVMVQPCSAAMGTVHTACVKAESDSMLLVG